MEFDNNLKEKLLSLSNDQLSGVISQISSAIGADRKKTDNMISNLDNIRVMFTQMTPADAERLISLAGKEKSDQIKNFLKDIKTDV